MTSLHEARDGGAVKGLPPFCHGITRSPVAVAVTGLILARPTGFEPATFGVGGL